MTREQIRLEKEWADARAEAQLQDLDLQERIKALLVEHGCYDAIHALEKERVALAEGLKARHQELVAEFRGTQAVPAGAEVAKPE